MAAEPRGRRRLLAKVALAAFSIAFTLVLLEVLIRVVYQQGGQPMIFDFDPVVGHRNRADVQLEHVWDARENISQIRTDEVGFRVSRPPDSPGSYRILMLGDSYTFGYGVGDEETFAAVLQRSWNSADPPRRGIAVMNGGVSAFGTAQATLLYEDIAALRPADLVILNVFVGNDIQDNLCLRLGSLTPHRRAPCFEVRDDELVLASRPQPPGGTDVSGRTLASRMRGWLSRTQLYTLLSQQALSWIQASPRLVGVLANVGIELDPGYLPHVVAGWYLDDLSARGWELTQRLISRLAESVAKNDGRLAVVLIPSRIQVLPDLARISRVLYPDDPEVEAFFDNPRLPQERLLSFLEGEGIPALDLMPAFEGREDVGELYYPVIAHWNERGHEVAADEIERFLASHRLVPPAPETVPPAPETVPPG